MASSNILRETVGDVTECPICTETMVDPRVATSMHSHVLLQMSGSVVERQTTGCQSSLSDVQN